MFRTTGARKEQEWWQGPQELKRRCKRWMTDLPIWFLVLFGNPSIAIIPVLKLIQMTVHMIVFKLLLRRGAHDAIILTKFTAEKAK